MLQLDDPVAKHLPGWPGGKVITLEHLLSHRSGIPSYTEGTGFEAWKKGPRTLADTLALFRDAPLEFDPGSDTEPSNSNTVLLGVFVRRSHVVDHADELFDARRYLLQPLVLRLHVDARVVVPIELGCNDAVAGEHESFGIDAYAGRGGLDRVVALGCERYWPVGSAGNEVPARGHRRQRDALEMPVRHRPRTQAGGHELLHDVVDRSRFAGCSRRAAVEVVGCEDGDVRAQP